MPNYNVDAVKDRSKINYSGSEMCFYGFPIIRQRISELAFGTSDISDPLWIPIRLTEQFMKDRVPFDRCLSICCGYGGYERDLTRLGIAKKIDGTDIAPSAIEYAKATAEKEGFTNINYFQADLNEFDITENVYDLVWANGALHHIRDLDIVIPKLFKSLRAGGMLVAMEYVGPNYQQLDLRHQEIINAIRHLLPDEFRGKRFYASNRSFWSKVIDKVNKFRDKRLNKSDENYFGKIWEMPSVNYFKKLDPSEGVNSQNIIPILQQWFSDITIRYFDGSILSYALDEKFYNNYNPDNPTHKNLLELLFQMEDHFISSGELGRHNAFIICKKPL